MFDDAKGGVTVVVMDGTPATDPGPMTTSASVAGVTLVLAVGMVLTSAAETTPESSPSTVSAEMLGGWRLVGLMDMLVVAVSVDKVSVWSTDMVTSTSGGWRSVGLMDMLVVAVSVDKESGQSTDMVTLTSGIVKEG